MKVALIRHSLAVDFAQTDEDRMLTPAGRKRLLHACRLWKKQEAPIEMIISSHYLRARQSASIIKKKLGIPGKRQQWQELAPLSDPGTIFPLLKALEPVDYVALVGHNPFMSILATTLLGCRDNPIQMAPAARIDIDIRHWEPTPQGILRFFTTPK